jgi:mono/diheme cytochrome c family protein
MNRDDRRGSGIWLIAVLLAGVSCSGESGSQNGRVDSGSAATVAVPAEFQQGETLYQANCALCHGPRGTGSGTGPPLVHRIYEPSHHADIAFEMAATRGVRAHHWSFGDMPPVAGISIEQVASITGYVRWLQRQAGIH